MKRHKVIGLLLLVAFIAPMGLNELAFAQNHPWDKKIVGAARWKLVLNNQAVLDKETGLVWDRSPGTSPMNWFQAISHCYHKEDGDRMGWRLPTVEEFTSLVDPTQSNPSLPAGHPFIGVAIVWYWTATTNAQNTSKAWLVGFGNLHVFDDGDKSDTNGGWVWCVRGGRGYDGQ